MPNAIATMQSTTNYLVPEVITETSGAGQPFDLGPLAGKRVLILLRITDIVEQESLQVSVWGSSDGSNWGGKPLFEYPQKFYQGVTPAALDLRQRPEVRFMQARWEMNRWGRGYPLPHFKFLVEIEEFKS